MKHNYVNEDEKFWKHSFLVSFTQCLGWDSAICVNADHEQDAVDFAADYAMEQGWIGYFMDEDDIEDEDEDEDDIIRVGNCGWPILSYELTIRQLD